MDANKTGLTSSKATTEALDPFSLHHSDHPGSIKPPSLTDDSFPSWQRCNDMVISWLLNSIHPDIASSVIYAETASEIWADLRERFSQGNDSRIYQIKRDIVEHRQGQQSISVYYTKLKAFWDELSSYHEVLSCSCGGLEKLKERDEKERVMQFLMGLNDSYVAIRGQILLMHPLPIHAEFTHLSFNKKNRLKFLSIMGTRTIMPCLQIGTIRRLQHTRFKSKRLHCTALIVTVIIIALRSVTTYMAFRLATSSMGRT
ncbi:hypothetical protein CK203_081580 [Vitis vinifera]|uniref:Uncharacterized protein n=1 Tax=Vitis vinifera TaxID=29760 RepID=A0A438E2C3_VITVI|nr:hypothetical protein CK203_081580 [Vitis vinifera]